ncbi:MAG TPA: hypothetical protein VHN14_14810, partial [Kofleriaceae bacterium]|nr:hypothetical protein [Kofleriaceae bacterium]
MDRCTTLVGPNAAANANRRIQNERGALSFAEKRGREGGLREGEQKGREEGLREGEQRGLRQAVEALCDVLGIELTDERRREMANLDAVGLAALLAR